MKQRNRLNRLYSFNLNFVGYNAPGQINPILKSEIDKVSPSIFYEKGICDTEPDKGLIDKAVLQAGMVPCNEITSLAAEAPQSSDSYSRRSLITSAESQLTSRRRGRPH